MSLFNTLASKFFLISNKLSFLSQLLAVTCHRSLFIKRSAPYFLLGSSKYIGLVSDLIVGFSYKPSLNVFFVHDFVLAFHCNQLPLTQRFSFDLETKTRQQNRNSKRTEIGRFDWLSERLGEKTSRPRTF